MKWVPYSYVGTAGTQIESYTGDVTGQHLDLSVSKMDDIYNLVQQNGGQGARLFVIGHSLGGAIAAFWGAQHPEAQAQVITLDSPVSGIWPTVASVYGQQVFPHFYCNSTLSVGLWKNLTNPFPQSCKELIGLPIMTCPTVSPSCQQLGQSADVIRDLQTATATEGRANAINFANSSDVVVPSWFALNPAVPGGQVLINDHCGTIASVILNWDPSVATDHYCVLANVFVLQSIADIVNDNANSIWGQRHQAPPVINLHITAQHKGTQIPIQPGGIPQPGLVQVSLARAGSDGSIQRIGATLNADGHGGVFATVPWTDLMVQGSLSTQQNCMAVLPAAPTVTTYAVSLNVGGGPGDCSGLQIP